jgi:hypothetical protein
MIHHCVITGLFLLGLALSAPVHAAERLRLIIETDAGGDPDDEQSLVRLLVYANEFDIEGIIANRPHARAGENKNPERTGLGIVRCLLKAYGECYTNLVQHDPCYPRPEQLWQHTVPGYDDTDDAVKLILAAVDSLDPRPVWYSDWGTDNGAATNNLRRALDRVRRERGPGGYAKFKSRLRLSSADKFAEHTTTVAPPFALWVDTFRPELERRRWYHRFSALTARAGGFDIERDVRTGHGPLGALYPTNTTHWCKEGDSMSFIYLLPTGLNDPNQPTWGSWAGRYSPNTNFPGRAYFWATAVDAWNGATNRENTLARWAAPLQNDFRVRLDWCVKDFAHANHPPRLTLNSVTGTEVLRLHSRAGAKLKLDASGSTDPDGHRLNYAWFIYPEPSTYGSEVLLDGTNTSTVTVRIPADLAGQTIHALAAVTDDGQPALTRYRRAVISISDAKSARRTIAPFFTPPAESANQFGKLRSPLLFNDGSRVVTAADWSRRRAEILRTWHELMGPWPPLVEPPRLEVLSESRRDNFKQRRVRLGIAPGQTGEGWLLLPDSVGPHPAVLVVYYEPETSVGLNPDQPLRDFGLQLARRGFVTLNLGTPGGNSRKPDTGGAPCQPLSFHAYVAANGWLALASLSEVDKSRIGVVGHSYGGKWAMFAAALWDKFACVAVSDPGIVFDETRPNVNYWEPWYLGLDQDHPRPRSGLPSTDNPRTGAYQRMIERGHDLHELHALIAPRPFLVSGGAEDQPSRWTALNHAVAVNQLLGYTNRVAMTNRKDHTPSEESNAQLYAFFEHFLLYGEAERK